MGKLYSEVCTRLILQQFDTSAVRSNVLVHDRQADAAAAHHILRLALAPVKRLKDTLTVSLRHANALVMKINAHQAGQPDQLEPDIAFQR